MKLCLFLYAIEIERCGSINRAAQNLYVSQSHLSSSIKCLEDDLGYQIFHRTPNGITVTSEGYYFLQSAKAIQSEIDKIIRVPEMTGRLDNISISCTWSSRFLQYFIDFKKKSNGNVRDVFKETGLIQNFQDVQENQYRLAVIYCFHSRTERHLEEAAKTNLMAEVIATHIPAVALMHADHPLACEGSVRLEQLYEHPFVLFDNFEDEDWADILGMPASCKKLYLFDKGAVLDAVVHGGYMSITKQGAVLNTYVEHVLELPISDLRDDLDVILIHKRTLELNQREKAFIKHLKYLIDHDQSSAHQHRKR